MSQRQPHDLFNTVMTEFLQAVKQLPLSYEERSLIEEYHTKYDTSVLLNPLYAAQAFFKTMQLKPVADNPNTYAYYLMLDDYESTAQFFCTSNIPFFQEMRFSYWMEKLNSATKYTIFAYLRNLYYLSSQVPN